LSADGRSISRPLAILHRGTRALMNSPETAAASRCRSPCKRDRRPDRGLQPHGGIAWHEQRSGLNDTLSLLDSMLANAPIGLAFFDRRCRFVRVNQVFAGMTGVPLSRHLGRTLPNCCRSRLPRNWKDTVLRVFADGGAGAQPGTERPGAATPGRSWTWLVSAYPVRTTPRQVRWVGVIVLDASDRKRSEEALRKTENWPQPAGWPLPSPTRSTIRWRPSPTCSSCCATSASLRTRR
jgi:PAS domain S-box-containing protein